jgi:hypothetical protein
MEDQDVRGAVAGIVEMRELGKNIHEFVYLVVVKTTLLFDSCTLKAQFFQFFFKPHPNGILGIFPLNENEK